MNYTKALLMLLLFTITSLIIFIMLALSKYITGDTYFAWYTIATILVFSISYGYSWRK